MILHIIRPCLLLIIAATLASCAKNTPDTVTLGVTSTLENSGLLEHLSSQISNQLTSQAGEQVSNYKVIVGPSGKILRLARDGELDIIITHHPAGELALHNDGHIHKQQILMHNQFLLVGPRKDPAHTATSIELTEAFKKIAQKKAPFISRADDSGTAQFEQTTWQQANIKNYDNNVNTGAGMADTLRVAVERKAYTVVDKATWLALEKETATLKMLFEDEVSMRNVYQVSLIAKADIKEPIAFANTLFNWLVSKQGQAAITDFRINEQQAFTSGP